jgi:lysophospholipase L1-like esterase
VINVERNVVACLGSSSTAGKGQAFDWIAELRRRPRNAQFEFRNFGVGGDFAFNALKRLPAVVACRPNKVLVWVGANDALALVSEKFRRIFSFVKRLHHPISSEWFRENLSQIAKRLKSETSADVGLCSLPPIGENLDSSDRFQAAINDRIQEFSNAIAQIAAETGCRYIPLYETLAGEMRGAPGNSYTAFNLLPFYKDAFRVLVLGQSPDVVADKNGWRFHTDGIHLNGRAGLLVANCVQDFISQ